MKQESQHKFRNAAPDVDIAYNGCMSNPRAQIFGLTVAVAIAFRAFGCCELPARMVSDSGEKGCCQSKALQPESAPAIPFDCCCKDDVPFLPHAGELTVDEPSGWSVIEPLVLPVEHSWNSVAADQLVDAGPAVRILQCVWRL